MSIPLPNPRLPTLALPTTFKVVAKLPELALKTLAPVILPPVPAPVIMLPVIVNTLDVLSNVKLALPFATPVSLNIICVLLPATGPVAPVAPS